jgi:hypothetical protein
MVLWYMAQRKHAFKKIMFFFQTSPPFYIIGNTHGHFLKILQISEFLFFNNLPLFLIIYSTNNDLFSLIKVKIQSFHSSKETMKWSFAKAFVDYDNANPLPFPL